MVKLAPITMRWRLLNWPPLARRIVTLAFFCFLNWLLLAPAETFRDVHVFLSHQDKLAHFVIFAVMAGLSRWSVPIGLTTGRWRPVLLLTLLAYGTAAESFQPLMAAAGRTFQWMDLLMNWTGAVAGVWLCMQCARSANTHLPPAPPDVSFQRGVNLS